MSGVLKKAMMGHTDFQQGRKEGRKEMDRLCGMKPLLVEVKCKKGHRQRRICLCLSDCLTARLSVRVNVVYPPKRTQNLIPKTTKKKTIVVYSRPLLFFKWRSFLTRPIRAKGTATKLLFLRRGQGVELHWAPPTWTNNICGLRPSINWPTVHRRTVVSTSREARSTFYFLQFS